jgi:hypothetical protein
LGAGAADAEEDTSMSVLGTHGSPGLFQEIVLYQPNAVDTHDVRAYFDSVTAAQAKPKP